MIDITKLNKDTLYFIPIGGSDEIGMNANIYLYRNEAIMVDMGIGFAHDEAPGVDVLVPDTTLLEQLGSRLKALFITHAHEDHIGAVSYLADAIHCPVYTSPLAGEVLAAKLADARSPYRLNRKTYRAGERIELGAFSIEPVPITHSIPEMHGFMIRTAAGNIFHTGDWKLDPNPGIGEATNPATLERLGDEGVLAMVCDSTNIFVEGSSGSEADVAASLEQVIGRYSGRVVVGSFATNVARLAAICRAAKTHGRKVALVGRSLWRISDAAQACGYLQEYAPFLTDKQAMELPRDRVLILATGCQGEDRAALSRIAQQNHPVVRIQAGDTVCFSSRDIPGNHIRIGHVQNALVRRGIEVVTSYDEDIHVSGHPARDELRQVYGWIRPTIAVPTHGEARHLHRHAAFARELGVATAIEAHNGAVIALSNDKPGIVGQVTAGYYGVDGSSLLPLKGNVLRTRERLRDNGAVFVSILADKKHDPEITISAPGMFDPEHDREMFSHLRDHLLEQWDAGKKKKHGDDMIKRIEQAARKWIERECDKRPYVVVHWMG